MRAILLIHQKRAWPVADHTELGMYDARAAVKCELLPSVVLGIINGKLGDFAKETQERFPRGPLIPTLPHLVSTLSTLEPELLMGS